MTGQVDGFQNAGVCLQVFPSCLDLPIFHVAKTLKIFHVLPTEMLAKQSIVNCDQATFLHMIQFLSESSDDSLRNSIRCTFSRPV